MKFATFYNKKFKYLDKIDELMFFYDEVSNDVLKTLKEEQAANIFLPFVPKEELDFTLLKSMREAHSNLVVTIGFEQLDVIEELKSIGIKYNFGSHLFTFESISNAIKQEPNEIYITGELGFSIPIIKKMVNGRCGIRIYPDVNQVEQVKVPGEEMSCLSGFWVRPEDIELYDDYIDTMEFFHTNPITCNALYEIYRQGQWRGNIDHIIQNIDTLDKKDYIGNAYIAPHFGKMRLNCRRKCLWGECQACQNIEDLARAMREAGIIALREKKDISDLKELTPEELKKFDEFLKNSGQI